MNRSIALTTLALLVLASTTALPVTAEAAAPGCTIVELDGPLLRIPGAEILRGPNNAIVGVVEWASKEKAGYGPCKIIANLLACARDIQACTSDELGIVSRSGLTYDADAPVAVVDYSTPVLDLNFMLAMSTMPGAEVLTQHEVLVQFNTKGLDT